MTLRREFQLLPDDLKTLEEYGLPWEAIVDGSPWILIHSVPVPVGYNHPNVTAAIRIETGYPHSELNMVYFSPELLRQDGKKIGATESTQVIRGITYQRWSRHRTPQNPWQPGRDNLGTHIILIEDWLAREFER